LDPVSDIAMPPTPDSTPTVAFGLTVTLRLSVPLLKLGARGFAAPEQVMPSAELVHTACAGEQAIPANASSAVATGRLAEDLPFALLVSGAATHTPADAFQTDLNIVFTATPFVIGEPIAPLSNDQYPKSVVIARDGNRG
jgi:hypothetical protein